MKNYFVYVYLNPMIDSNIKFDDCTLLNEPFYVGMGKGDRHLHHLKSVLNGDLDKSNPHKSRKIRKIIDDGKFPIIIKIKEELSHEDASNLEKKLIKTIGTRTKIIDHPIGPLTNLKEGGSNGRYSEAAKEKLRIHTGKNLSEETKELVSKNTKIALQDPIIRKKISDSQKGLAKPKSRENLIKSQLEGKINSVEQRQRSRDRMTNRTVSPEEKQKISIAVSNHVSNTIWINNGSKNQRIIISNPIPNGWVRGRFMDSNFKKKLLDSRTKL